MTDIFKLLDEKSHNGSYNFNKMSKNRDGLDPILVNTHWAIWLSDAMSIFENNKMFQKTINADSLYTVTVKNDSKFEHVFAAPTIEDLIRLISEKFDDPKHKRFVGSIPQPTTQAVN